MSKIFEDENIHSIELHKLKHQYAIGLEITSAISGIEIILTEAELRAALKYIEDNKDRHL